ncbi:hypothetical protein D623_10011683 [Myotis brandtii]|uniref:Uncharacterized protein n=1 Tax=Myotis brandtii TaxID=109478 RepID=S7NTC2_MYOBR|nr:hypothetical protein D623_10011683 [Myotis brandtii]
MGCSQGGRGSLRWFPRSSRLGAPRLARVHVHLYWAMRCVPGGGNVLRIVSAHVQDNPREAAGVGLLALRRAWHRGAQQCLRHQNQAKVCLRLTQTHPGSPSKDNRARGRPEQKSASTSGRRSDTGRVTITWRGLKNKAFEGGRGRGSKPNSEAGPASAGMGQR